MKSGVLSNFTRSQVSHQISHFQWQNEIWVRDYPEPYHFTDWSPDSFLAVEPGAQTHFARSPAFPSLIIRVPDCIDSWLLPFCVSLCVVNVHKETESEEKTVYYTQGRSQPFCMEGFLMYIACRLTIERGRRFLLGGSGGMFPRKKFWILGLQKWRFLDFEHKFPITSALNVVCIKYRFLVRWTVIELKMDKITVG